MKQQLRPFSDHRRGLFVSIDGPSGSGKSTIVAHLSQLLVADGEHVHTTAEPSNGVLGKIAREMTETVTGPALACLYAADRYHHLETEIQPHLDAGEVVLCDRYVPSALVMQRFDGVDPVFLWGLNSLAERPDLAVLLEGAPELISARLTERGAHNRFQLTPRSSHAEAHFYRQAYDRLIQAGYDVLRIDIGTDAHQIAVTIRDRLREFFAVGDRPPKTAVW
ncbi:dTMP kinase [Nonomuraea sp. NPDC046802]|uniref:dTMP kinase n=1 Tax=Nonomuraea sp. NPDC046802 TaxID=3154919 RepID=UPI0033CE4420